MQQIINRLMYDTEKANLLAHDEFWDGHKWNQDARNTYLYKTLNGRFFLLHSSRWEGERDYIEPVSSDEARQLYEDLPEHVIPYAEVFGEEPEEA